eukprot:COSAG02_NODE_9988_length_2056_cov_4.618293_1_plen_132_part_10
MSGADVAVTFTQPGSLGLKFAPNTATDTVEVYSINPGTQATSHAQLKPGLTLLAVGATSCVGMPYKQVIETIRAQGRPVTLEFSSSGSSPAQSPQAAAPAPAPTPAAAPPVTVHGADVAVTFTQPGSLGLKF